jgi:bifunctional DNA-binding transcriptional regulator/antitoxin component of YhaV-PrlF toxin-antitoxin module
MSVHPEEVRWAFGLNEGDLLVCKRRFNELALAGYGRTVRQIVEVCGDPWLYLEREVLNRPQVALGQEGRVGLPAAYRRETGLAAGDRVELEARIRGSSRDLVLRPRVELSPDGRG